MIDSSAPRQLPTSRGFTLIELLVVVSIIAILAMIAVPSMQERIVREQVVEGAKLADDVVKGPIATFWKAHGQMPSDNAEANVPTADKIVGNVVTAITVEDGAIHISFGNNANSSIKGRTLTLRPAVVVDTPEVTPTWMCASRQAPSDKMTLQGHDRTDIDNRFLPVNCRRLDG